MSHLIGTKTSSIWAIKDPSSNMYLSVTQSEVYVQSLRSYKRQVYSVIWKPVTHNIAKTEKGCREILAKVREYWIASIQKLETDLDYFSSKIDPSILPHMQPYPYNSRKTDDLRDRISQLNRYLTIPLEISNVTITKTVTEVCIPA